MSLLRWAVLAIMAGFMAGGCIRAEDGAVLQVPAMPEWKLLHQVSPEYPALALQRHIQGVVRFTALIGKDGRIERLSLISGHPLLVAAAARAAKQWIYRPMTIHGNPARVSTRIAVTFALDERGKPIQDERRFREQAPVV
ncbi:MAG: energy transducer TonB [Terracidiphilus sp.]|nr:energy transducer TonB [Terracidiphilus sp.]